MQLERAWYDDRMVVVGAIEAERLADLARTGDEACLCERGQRGGDLAPDVDELVARDDLGRADEDGRADAFPIGDEVEHPVDAITEVDVGVTRLAEHGRVALGLAEAAVVGGVAAVAVGLGLGDAQGDPPRDELAADEVNRHLEGVAGEEVAARPHARPDDNGVDAGEAMVEKGARTEHL